MRSFIPHLCFVLALAVSVAGCNEEATPSTSTDTSVDADASGDDAASDVVDDGGEEDTGSDDTGGHDAGADGSADADETDADAATDAALDAATDASLDAGSCTAGDERTDGCTTCYCVEDDVWQCWDDEWCVYEACLAECPTSCDPVGDQVCGARGLTRYCTACHLACADDTATDPVNCDEPWRTCDALPPDATPVEWARWTPPDCVETLLFDGGETWLHRDAVDFYGSFPCTEGMDLGVDWSTQNVIQTAFLERTDPYVVGVYERPEHFYVYLGSGPYCGGPAPSTEQIFLLIDKSSAETVEAGFCYWGECLGPPAP